MPASANCPDRVMIRPILMVSWALAGAAPASSIAATPPTAVVIKRIEDLPEMSWRCMGASTGSMRVSTWRVVARPPGIRGGRALFHPGFHRILDVLDLVDLDVAQAVRRLFDLLN